MTKAPKFRDFISEEVQRSDIQIAVLTKVNADSKTVVSNMILEECETIAWSTLEYLHDASACRTLFATHYHELTHLQKTLGQLRCHAMQVREWQGSIVFLHQVVPGSADRSYGVHVARLAGLPATVLGRAETILGELETGQHGAVDAGMMADNLPLFDYQSKALATLVTPDEIGAVLDDMQPDSLTPREALDMLYRLKALRHDPASSPPRSGDKE